MGREKSRRLSHWYLYFE